MTDSNSLKHTRNIQGMGIRRPGCTIGAVISCLLRREHFKKLSNIFMSSTDMFNSFGGAGLWLRNC